MENRLQRYHEKRNFLRTNEPVGLPFNNTKKEDFQFVIQFHQSKRAHYDLRLKWRGVLLSWAIMKEPSFFTDDKRLAIRVEDHPSEYADFEGTIPPGEYGAGTVTIWDRGTYQVKKMDQSLKNGMIKLYLMGQKLKGKWVLLQLKKEEKNWLFIKEKDEYGKEKKTKTFQNQKTIKKTVVTTSKNPFSHADVQLAKLTAQLPEKNYIYEIKYDGYRTIAYLENDQVRLQSRNHRSFNELFSSIISDLKDLAKGRSMVLDGEMVVLDSQGRSDFQLLQHYLKEKKGPLTYVIFDLLAIDGKDLRPLSLLERKKKLATLMEKSGSGLLYSRHIDHHLQKLIAAGKKMNLEGIVAKRMDSPYRGIRNDDWLKLKFRKKELFFIGGYVGSVSSEDTFRSLLVGSYEEKKLIYRGKVGSGIKKDLMRQMLTLFSSIRQKSSPFATTIPSESKIVYLRPEYVIEVEYTELTEKRLLRHASFIRILKKENSSDENREITLTHPERLVFLKPKLMKKDLSEYYTMVADRLLFYARNHLLSVVRCPENVTQPCYLKKHPDLKKPMNHTYLSDGKRYFYLNDLFDLLQEVQNGTVEFHLWGSEIATIDEPSWLIFDLDPDEQIQLSQLRQGVRDLKKILDRLSFRSFLKTSGGKGYHIVVPLASKISWEIGKQFAQSVAIYMEQRWPEKYTSKMQKKLRKGKIFIDWMRNGKGATCIAPYSLRIKENAPVSMPIFWKELDRIAPDGIQVKDAMQRIKMRDPWWNFFKVENKLKEKDYKILSKKYDF